MNFIKKLEDKLALMHNKKYCILTGRASSALWMAYKCCNSKKSKVIVPSIMCLSPTLVLKYANKKPLFSDVLIKDATINPKNVESLLKKNKDISAVLAVHLYGYPCQVNELKKICDKENVKLIEDVAQAMGARDNNNKILGSTGDISILSFGNTKILDLEEGGALLTNDKKTYFKSLKLRKNIKNVNINSLKKLYKPLYYKIFNMGQENKKIFDLFNIFSDLFKNLYIRNTSQKQAKKIFNKLDSLENEIKHRRKIYSIYEKNIKKNNKIIFFKPQKNFVPWRFNFKIKKNYRDKLIKHIRNRGFDISSWYPNSKNWFFEGKKQKNNNFKVSEYLDKSLINLWVTKNYSSLKAKKLASEINKFTNL